MLMFNIRSVMSLKKKSHLNLRPQLLSLSRRFRRWPPLPQWPVRWHLLSVKIIPHNLLLLLLRAGAPGSLVASRRRDTAVTQTIGADRAFLGLFEHEAEYATAAVSLGLLATTFFLLLKGHDVLAAQS